MIVSNTNQIIYPLLPFLESQQDIRNKLMEFLSQKEIGRFCSTCRTVVNMSQGFWRHYFFQVLHREPILTRFAHTFYQITEDNKNVKIIPENIHRSIRTRQLPTKVVCVWTMECDGTEHHTPTVLRKDYVSTIIGKSILFCKQDGTGRYYLTGHTGPIRCLTKLRDGCFATGSADKTIRVWDQENKVSVVLHHTGKVSRILELKDNTIAAGGNNGELMIWQRNGLLARHLQIKDEDSVKILSIQELQRGSLAAVTKGKWLYVWKQTETRPTMVKVNQTIRSLDELEDESLDIGLKTGIFFSWDRKKNTVKQSKNLKHSIDAIKAIKDGCAIGCKNKLLIYDNDFSLKKVLSLNTQHSIRYIKLQRGGTLGIITTGDEFFYEKNGWYLPGVNEILEDCVGCKETIVSGLSNELRFHGERQALKDAWTYDERWFRLKQAAVLVATYAFTLFVSYSNGFFNE